MAQLYKTLVMLIFSAGALHAQEPGRKLLKGKVSANSTELSGINVLNLQADRSTVTQGGGYFEVPARPGDTLMFSAVQFKALKIVLKPSDFDGELFFAKMEILQRQLDEVKINEYKNINAVSLRILSKPAKKYTPAERRLATAEELHWYSPLLIPVGGMSVDGMINSISGRTAMLRKELDVEKKEFLLKKITGQFEEAYFIETLKIPPDYVKGFQYYLIEDEAFVTAINDKNKTMAAFLMNKLATEYLQLIAGK